MHIFGDIKQKRSFFSLFSPLSTLLSQFLGKYFVQSAIFATTPFHVVLF